MHTATPPGSTPLNDCFSSRATSIWWRRCPGRSTATRTRSGPDHTFWKRLGSSGGSHPRSDGGVVGVVAAGGGGAGDGVGGALGAVVVGAGAGDDGAGAGDDGAGEADDGV